MTSDDYRALREDLGTRAEVAKLLGVAEKTLERRESGKVKCTSEAQFALRWLGSKDKVSGRDKMSEDPLDKASRTGTAPPMPKKSVPYPTSVQPASKFFNYAKLGNRENLQPIKGGMVREK